MELGRGALALGLCLSIAIYVVGCTPNTSTELAALNASGARDERALAACQQAFGPNVLTNDDVETAKDATVEELRVLMDESGADQSNDWNLEDADDHDYVAICIIGGAVAEKSGKSHLIIYAFEDAQRSGLIATN